MIKAGLLLAAGRSRRFGKSNKLLALLDGQPLVTHVARAMQAVGFDRICAVASDTEVSGLLQGFELIEISEPAEQSRSLAEGIRALEDATQITIVLGDMPRVTPQIIRQVTDLCPVDGASASSNGKRRLPPAAFHKALFPSLTELSGDTGAAGLLRAIPEALILRPDPACLVDVDTPEDLARLSGGSRPGE